MNKGQSTVEYLLLVTAVIGVVVAFLLTDSSLFKTRLNSVLTNVTNQMSNVGERLTNSL